MEDREREMVEKLKSQLESVQAPDRLKPGSIESLLEEKGRKTRKHVWKRSYGVALAVACCLLVCTAAFSLGRMDLGTDHAVDTADNTSSVSENSRRNTQETMRGTAWQTADSYEEIYSYAEAYLEEIQESAKYESSAEIGETADSTVAFDAGGASFAQKSEIGIDEMSQGSYSGTNVRQEGVDEADVVKTDGRYLYTLLDNGEAVSIVDTLNGELFAVGEIVAGEDMYVYEFYVADDRLVMICGVENEEGVSPYGAGMDSGGVAAVVYDISDVKTPKEMGRITQSGTYTSSRMAGGYLYLFSQFYVSENADSSHAETYIPLLNGEIMPRDGIYLPITPQANVYEVITSVDLERPAEICDSKAIFTKGGELYVSNENIYWYEIDGSEDVETVIRKLSYKDGAIKGSAAGSVDGYINDSFSIDEYDGYLRTVTTDGDTNGVYVLDEELDIVGRIEGLAEDERIYSARFFGETGYFVTFKETDPLFTVDVSDPENPEIIGELKIPGFSEYLHFYGEGKLLGIGMDVDEETGVTGGVKLSMFDISDPSDVKEEAVHIMENVYSADALYDYKAVLIDANENLIGFSAQESNGKKYYVFSYSADQGFICQMKEQVNGDRYSSVRGVYIDDILYVVNGNIIESYSMGDYKKIDDVIL